MATGFNAKAQRRKGAERRRQPNLFGLRREAKRHAALEARSAVEKRCRRCALPPQSKILAIRDDHDRLQCVAKNGRCLPCVLASLRLCVKISSAAGTARNSFVSPQPAIYLERVEPGPGRLPGRFVVFGKPCTNYPSCKVLWSRCSKRPGRPGPAGCTPSACASAP